MTISKRLGSLVAALITGATAVSATTTTSGGTTPCKATASAARQAAIRDAQAEYWIAVAKCLNGPGVGQCKDEAEDALDEALDLAQDQYEERIDACALLGQGAYNPQLDADDFSAHVTNPYFRLIPGRTLVYEKQTEDGLERVEVKTLHGTVEIDGIPCRAVRDTVYLDGELIEDTIDWFSQHDNGTVWYLGEIAKNFVDGFLNDIDGSWRSGVDGAKAGRIMLGDPDPGDAYRQEFQVGEAEDIGKVLALGQTVHVPAGTFHNCLKTKDWTPISPDSFEHKFYAPGIGMVLEVDPESGERLELVAILN